MLNDSLLLSFTWFWKLNEKTDNDRREMFRFESHVRLMKLSCAVKNCFLKLNILPLDSMCAYVLTLAIVLVWRPVIELTLTWRSSRLLAQQPKRALRGLFI